MAKKKKRRRKTPIAVQRERWQVSLEMRAALMQQVAACIGGTGDCTHICHCVGDACRCIGVGNVPAALIAEASESA